MAELSGADTLPAPEAASGIPDKVRDELVELRHQVGSKALINELFALDETEAYDIAEGKTLHGKIRARILEALEDDQNIDSRFRDILAREFHTTASEVWEAFQPLIDDQTVVFGSRGYHAPKPGEIERQS